MAKNRFNSDANAETIGDSPATSPDPAPALGVGEPPQPSVDAQTPLQSEAQRIEAEKPPAPGESVADKVIHSHVGLEMIRRSEPFDGELGEVIFKPEIGMRLAEVLVARGVRTGFVDMVVSGYVNRSALKGDLSLLKDHPRIKLC